MYLIMINTNCLKPSELVGAMHLKADTGTQWHGYNRPCFIGYKYLGHVARRLLRAASPTSCHGVLVRAGRERGRWIQRSLAA